MEFFKMSNIVSFLITIALHLVISQGDEVKVTTTYGTIQGNIRSFADIIRPIKAVDKFLGIPYAAPPVGELRFKPPQPPHAWKPAIYNASYFRSVCIQDPEYNNFFWPNLSISQSEDCLYLNVYSPHRNPDSKELYPVMVYIHGGGYDAGTPAVSPGDVIPLWGVVLVTIQYRLGPFGFITSGDLEAPGNYGMLDQIEALKWVKNNIRAFGGNSSVVTIFGESAGGSSVGLLLLSPLSKGLFHRAISISGVDLSPFAIGSTEEVTKQSEKVAKQVGCSVEDSSKMIKCLRSVDALKFPVKEVNVWRPIVDGNFLADTPTNLRNSGNFHYVPYMAGFTSREGSYFFPEVLDHVTHDNFRLYTETIFYNIGNKYGQMLDGDLPKSLLDAITLLYTPWPDQNDDIKTKIGMADEVGDFTMTAPTHTDLVLHSKYAPVFMYEFAYRSKLNPSPCWKGAAHKDDTPYEFGFPLMNLTVLQQYNDVDRNISDMLITLFTNFAKYGNPTPQPMLGVSWEGFNSSHMAYFRIQTQPEMAAKYRPTKMAFWNEYYERMLVEPPYTCESTSSALKSCLSFYCLVVFLCFFLLNVYVVLT
ncbi:hypothetical protein ACROYT_G024580 [Oculina patagonica]